ncbi:MULTISPECIES: exodeoxyribonuclease V subunit beta [Rheinheimera]|uniref:RecBCD enzyme subunit RecB n=1 Tax=Rheinheimera marina TaxID=1774958 RepID=A0ABV9JQY3_9GAMM
MLPLNIAQFPLQGSQLIEASAGTGKTFTIAALYLRLVLGHGRSEPLLPPDILVVTFTDAATRELTERIAQRLADAARYFRQLSEQADPVLTELRASYPPAQWPLCAYRLELAVQYLDEAAISTIHGWCNRVLAEFALPTGQVQQLQLVTDTDPLQQQVMRDYWRCWYYPLPETQLSQVLELWQQPEQLLSAVRPIWPHLAHFEQPAAPAESLQAVQQQKQQLLTALKAPWLDWADEIEQLLLQAIAAKAVDGRKLRENYLRGWLDKLRAWAQDPVAEQLDLQTGFTRLTPEGLAEVFKGPAPQHPAFDAMRQLPAQLAALPQPRRALLLHAAWWFSARFSAQLQQRSELGFDALLTRLQQALTGTESSLAQRLRQRYPVALIDEFQDTDPVQYQLFDAIYRLEDNRQDCAVVLIGDPKQAIYAFRGADIYSYLQAKQATLGRHYQLMVNYRSTPALIDALNFVFTSAEQRPLGTFVLAEKQLLNYQAVSAAGRKEQFYLDGEPAAALALCLYPTALDKPLAKAEYLAQMAQACAEQIALCLNQTQQQRCGFWQPDQNGVAQFTALQSNDIAVLVNNQQEARQVKQALRQRGLPAVYLSDKGTVFDSPLAQDVLLWLRACAEPERESLLRSALGSWSLQRSYAELATLLDDELGWEQLRLQFDSYHQRWAGQGVLVMLWQLMQDFAVAEFLQQLPDGERLLTDLLHLAELLQQKSAEQEGMAGLVRYLAEHLAGTGQSSADEQKLRLESDEQLIRIVTIHKSKGLEYPLVFLPFIAASRTLDANKGPISYHPSAAELVVRLDASDDELALAERERLAEEMRKLYVALTRARHYCWLGLAAQKDASAIGYLLSEDARLSPQALAEQFSPWLAHQAIVQAEFLAGQQSQVQLAEPLSDQQAYRQMQRPVRELWWMASYSALLSKHDEQTKAAELYAELSVEQQGAGAAAAMESDSPVAAVQPERFSQQFSKGSKAGSFLHDALEWAAGQGFAQALAKPDLWLEPLSQLAQRYQLMQPLPDERWQASWQDEAGSKQQLLAPVLDWLLDLLRAPALQGQSLVMLSPGQYQAELEFYLPVQQVPVKALDQLISAAILPQQPRPALSELVLGGMLKGFIDLTLVQQGRYQVLDYKSNFDASGQYDQGQLSQQFLQHRYDVQACLYQLALHRLLKSRLPGYQPAQHLGPALYWFIRGAQLAGAGVLTVDIPLDVLLQLDALLSGQRNTGH